MTTMTNPAVFLDRDGTIMEDSNYVGQVERVVLIPGAAQALKRLQDAGYRLFIVTNQSGVGRGFFTRDAVEEIHAHLREEFGRLGVQFERFYICPHHPQDRCDCRKPSARFLREAAAEFGLDMKRSFMVGDRASDVQTGINAGAQTILLLTGAGRDTAAAGSVKPDKVAADLTEAADWILGAS
jgi:D-glycero-D-manno-heptose 1,7-bisphosphate phosphatase